MNEPFFVFSDQSYEAPHYIDIGCQQGNRSMPFCQTRPFKRAQFNYSAYALLVKVETLEVMQPYQNTNLIKNLAIVRTAANSAYDNFETIFESSLLVITIITIGYSLFENSDRPFAEWIPQMKSIFFILVVMVISFKPWQLVIIFLNSKWIAYAQLLREVASLLHVVLNFAFWTNSWFFSAVSWPNQGENEVVHILKNTLKVLIGLALLLSGLFSFGLQNSYLNESYEAYKFGASLAFWIMYGIFFVISSTFACMTCCNSSLK